MNVNSIAVVTPIMQKIVDAIMNNSIDALPPTADPEDDSPFERSLCAAWDVCTVEEYAVAMNNLEFHRVLLKAAIATTRVRTRELSMGTLANMASHWAPGVGPALLNDLDNLKLCRSILWTENDARVLLETTRLLYTFLSCSIDTDQQTVIEHDHLTEFLTPVPMAPSVFQQYTTIICNTLHSELLLKSLELLTRIVVYTNAVTHSITKRRQQQEQDKAREAASLSMSDSEKEQAIINKEDTLKLIRWGADRLEEEGRGVGVGMGFHRGIAKNVMYLLWTLMAYGLVNIDECGPETALCLNVSMSRLVSYIQEEDDMDAKRNEDEEIQNLAQALNMKLSFSS